MKRITIFTLLSLLTIKVIGQETIYNSQYSQLGPVINPAFTGIDNFLDLKTNYRSEWSGYEGAPKTNFIGIYGNLKKETQASSRQYSLRTSNPAQVKSLYKEELSISQKLRHGIGGQILLNKQGPFRQVLGSVNYAMHIPLSSQVFLSLGFSAGINNNQIDVESIILRDENDEYYQKLIAQGSKNTYFDISPGFVLYSRQFYISYCANQLTRKPLSVEEGIEDQNSPGHKIWTGVNFFLDENVKLQPSFFYFQNDLFPSVWGATVKTTINQKGWGGISYKSSDVLVFMAGIYINNLLNVSYSYDLQISKYNSYLRGGHEVTLGLMLLKKDFKTPYL